MWHSIIILEKYESFKKQSKGAQDNWINEVKNTYPNKKEVSHNKYTVEYYVL